MKYLAILALAAAAFGFSACAKDHSEGVTTTTHSSGEGYKK